MMATVEEIRKITEDTVMIISGHRADEFSYSVGDMAKTHINCFKILILMRMENCYMKKVKGSTLAFTMPENSTEHAL